MSDQNRESKSSQQIVSDIRSEATEGSESKMKITDLNIICLEEIFEYLDLENLLNVADSNKRLNIAACFVFRRKHGKKEVQLRFSINKNLCEFLIIFNGKIYVRYNKKHHLRFLRCFGCVTSNLTINFQKVPQNQVDKICFHINEYCAESLIKLDIKGMSKDAIIFTHIQRPFVNIEIVSFSGGNLGPNIIQFNKWFPKMRHLELHENQLADKECIEMHFPNLRYLEYRPIEFNKNFVAHIEKIIRLNPNLRNLLLHDWNEKLLQNISKYLPQLEELSISEYLLNAAEPDCISDQVNFNCLKKLDIQLFSVSSERFLKTNFLFDQIEEFYAFGIKFNNLLTFVKKYSTIKKLKLHCSYINDDMNTENILQVAKTLPLLSELHLHQNVSVDEVIRFLDELKQVKNFHFRFYDQPKLDDLRVRLKSKWKVSIHPEQPVWGIWILLQCCH